MAFSTKRVDLKIISPFIPNLAQPNQSSNTNEPYLEYYQFLMGQNNSAIPQVISHSYGDDEQVRLPS